MKIKIWLGIIVLLFAVYFVIRPEYKYELLYSTDKKKVVTRVEYQSMFLGRKTYFTPGLYKERSRPEINLHPKYRGLTSGFQLIIHWMDEKCYFWSYLDNFEINNPNNDFIFEKISVDEFMEMKNDTSGQYIYQIERNIFN